mmetsp:Transcript_27061/g.69634  ORF Transcript_27061/g.69634 Transcript_27061/m.69634 type:complete len:548 (-) Transcript_27061:1723-3366(-)
MEGWKSGKCLLALTSIFILLTYATVVSVQVEGEGRAGHAKGGGVGERKSRTHTEPNTVSSPRTFRIVDDYYAREKGVEEVDVTMTTQLTAERIPALIKLCNSYGGPMSVAYYAGEESEVERLDEAYASEEGGCLRQHASVVLVHKEKGPYPVNMMRNIALRSAVSDYVFPIDVDFVVSAGFYQYIKQDSNVLDYLRNNKAIYILPSFELTQSSTPTPWKKEEVVKLYKDGFARPAHHYYEPCQRATNFKKWAEVASDYAVKYESGYEPYFVTHRTVLDYDERFIGRGGNKQSHPMELACAGYEFWVFSSSFLVHFHQNKKNVEYLGNQWTMLEVTKKYEKELFLRYNGCPFAPSMFDLADLAKDKKRAEEKEKERKIETTLASGGEVNGRNAVGWMQTAKKEEERSNGLRKEVEKLKAKLDEKDALVQKLHRIAQGSGGGEKGEKKDDANRKDRCSCDEEVEENTKLRLELKAAKKRVEEIEEKKQKKGDEEMAELKQIRKELRMAKQQTSTPPSFALLAGVALLSALSTYFAIKWRKGGMPHSRVA